MIDLHWSDLTKAPNEPNQDGFIVLTNPQWELVKSIIQSIKAQEKESEETE